MAQIRVTSTMTAPDTPGMKPDVTSYVTGEPAFTATHIANLLLTVIRDEDGLIPHPMPFLPRTVILERVE